MDQVENPGHDKIRKDLVRTVIKEPLYSELSKPSNQKALLPIIVEVNDEYYEGHARAAEWLTELVNAAVIMVAGDLTPQVLPIGSAHNPYYKVRLPPDAILALVELDYQQAKREQRALLEAQKATASSDAAMAVRAPTQLVRYLLIRRIWLDHALQPLIDRSISTVKADAARRAFLAEGRDIVWAVIDSGVDGTHRHFDLMRNLDVTLPVLHCDFTIPNGAGSPTALVDRYGHGTHVAGIIAGGLDPAGAPGVAKRTRMGVDQQIETFEEPVRQISGMAPSCRIVSMKVLDDNGQGEVSNIIAAIDMIQTIN